MAPKKEIIEESLPTAEAAKKEAEKVFAPLLTSVFQPILKRLSILTKSSPQVILFEGADAFIRLSLAKYWAALLNCQEVHKPCMHCVTCLEIANILTPDFFVFDGTKASIKIDDMRALKPLIATSSQQLKTRIILFYEAGAFTPEAANSLLKILEEPNNTTHFIITAPQRERVLPTLVSRSITVTLPSLLKTQLSSDALEWLNAMHSFFTTGKGWFDLTSQKNIVDNTLALTLIHLLMQQLTFALAPMPQVELHGLAAYLQKNITPTQAIQFFRLTEEAQNALQDTVNPALVLDYLMTQLLFLIKYKK